MELKVELVACGHEATVNVADYPQATLEAWVTYGVRRWYQDHCNSVAAKLKAEGQPVDGKALFGDRDKTAREGLVAKARTSRKAPASLAESILLDVVKRFAGKLWAVPKGTKPQAQAQAFYDSWGDKRRALVDAEVARQIEFFESGDDADEPQV